MKHLVVTLCFFALLFHISTCDDDSSQEDKSEEVMKELKKNVSSLWSYVRKMHHGLKNDIHQLQLHQREVADKLKSIFGVKLEHVSEEHQHPQEFELHHEDDSHSHGHHDDHHDEHHEHHHDERQQDHHDDGHHDHHADGHHEHHDDGHHDHEDKGHHDHHDDDGHHDHHDDGHHDHHDDHHHEHHDHHDVEHSEHHDQHHDEHSGHHVEHPHDHHDDHRHDNQSDPSHSHPGPSHDEQPPTHHDDHDQDHSHHDRDHHEDRPEHTSEAESSHRDHDDHSDHASNETQREECHHHHHHHHHGVHQHHEHNQHSHHHKHSSRLDPSKYDFAVCMVQPNTVIADEKQQNVTGIIRLWQEKNGTTLHIHIKVRGFKVDGDHSEHNTGEDQPHSKHRHGFHVHENGDLSNGCQSTGPHYSVENVDHGGPTSPIRHTGDLGNIECDEHGVTNVVLTDTVASLQGEHSIIGKSLVIHERRDDLGIYKDNEASRSSGDAGARIACCIIESVDRLPTGYDHHHGHHHHHHRTHHH